MSLKNARTLGLRLDDIDAADLTAFEKATYFDGVALARASLKASLASYKTFGSLSLPLHIVSHSQMQKLVELESQNFNPPTVTQECQTTPAVTADSTNTTPTNPPTPQRAKIVPLPQPPALATAGRWSLNETPTSPPVTEDRKPTTYPKHSRKKSG